MTTIEEIEDMWLLIEFVKELNNYLKPKIKLTTPEIIHSKGLCSFNTCTGSPYRRYFSFVESNGITYIKISLQENNYEYGYLFIDKHDAKVFILLYEHKCKIDDSGISITPSFNWKFSGWVNFDCGDDQLFTQVSNAILS